MKHMDGGILSPTTESHMSKNEARRQKQLAKKKAKRVEKRTEIARQSSDNPLIRLAEAESWPIVDALVPESLWAQGIGQLLITRRLPDGRLAIANFLVDVFCLGVKNAYWNIISEWEFDKLKRKLEGMGPLHTVTPEQFAKLVYGAVDFAQAVGIVPHPEYRHAKLLLTGIDPSRCTDVFTYGRDGKPFFVNGPHDTPEKIKIIMHKIKLAGGESVLLEADADGEPVRVGELNDENMEE
jgi:hypothetical protein